MQSVTSQINRSTLHPASARPKPPVTTRDEKTVWLVHGSHTGGHRSAAESLKQVLDQAPNVRAEVINLADTSEAKTPASTAAEVALKGGAWINSIRRWVFDQQFEGNKALKWISNKVMAAEADSQQTFLDRLEQEKPDLIVSTMSATNSLLSQLKEEGRVEPAVHSVITDFAAHQMWAQENIAYYYVATEQVKEDLERFGVDSAKVEVTGIPIKEQFAKAAGSPSQAKSALGLEAHKPLVLMMGGSLGHGSFEENLMALDSVEGDFQMAAITGRNPELQTELSQLPTEHSLIVEGYVENMPTWLEAADLVISKPGGLSCSEILAKGKPLLMQDKSSGLEARLIDRLQATGAAVVAKNPEELSQVLQHLMDHPQEAEELRERAREVGKPNSSQTIAQRILASSSVASRSDE